MGFRLSEKDKKLQHEEVELSYLHYLLENSRNFFENEEAIDPSLFTGNRRELFTAVKNRIKAPDYFPKPDLPKSPMLGELGIDSTKALKQLAQFASNRELVDGLQDALVTSRNIKESGVEASTIVKKILGIITKASRRFVSGTRTINAARQKKTILGSIGQRIEALNNKNYYPGLETGYNFHSNRRMGAQTPGLDDVLGGLQTGIHCLAGASGAGKSTFANNLAFRLGLKGINTLFISFEMPAHKMIIKNVAMAYELEETQIVHGRTALRIVENAYTRSEKALSHINYVEADRTTTIEEVETMASTIQAKSNDKRLLIIVDYLQLWAKLTRDESSRAFDTNTLVSDMVGKIRMMARSLDVPVLLIASQNRAAQNTGKGAELTSLKDSGDIEYTADSVWFLNPKPEQSEDEGISQITMTIAKNRYGEAPQKIEFNYTKKLNLFAPDGVTRQAYYKEINGEGFYMERQKEMKSI